jgi:hypothetical protein
LTATKLHGADTLRERIFQILGIFQNELFRYHVPQISRKMKLKECANYLLHYSE